MLFGSLVDREDKIFGLDKNQLTEAERKFKDKLERANSEIKAAQLRRNNIVKECVHRIREEIPLAFGRNNYPIWPTHPRCLLCNVELEFEKYCPSSPTLMCQFKYKNKKLQSGLDLCNQHTISVGLGTLDTLKSTIEVECIHCNRPYEEEF